MAKTKCKDEIVVNTLFHKQTRKFRKRPPRKSRRKIEVTNLTESLENCWTITSLVIFVLVLQV